MDFEGVQNVLLKKLLATPKSKDGKLTVEVTVSVEEEQEEEGGGEASCGVIAKPTTCCYWMIVL